MRKVEKARVKTNVEEEEKAEPIKKREEISIECQ